MIRTVMGKTPQLAPDVFVAENAAVAGDVRIGAGSSVWYGAVVRGDSAPITVGERTSIQDNVTLHCDASLRVGNDVTIGHNAVVHCAAVGDDCLIGMGAILLDGAVIGKNCIVAAGAVVLERAVIPDNTLVAGVPAKIVKTLPEGCLHNNGMAEHYVAMAREYAGK